MHFPEEFDVNSLKGVTRAYLNEVCSYLQCAWTLTSSAEILAEISFHSKQGLTNLIAIFSVCISTYDGVDFHCLNFGLIIQQGNLLTSTMDRTLAIVSQPRSCSSPVASHSPIEFNLQWTQLHSYPQLGVNVFNCRCTYVNFRLPLSCFAYIPAPHLPYPSSHNTLQWQHNVRLFWRPRRPVRQRLAL